MSSTGFRPTTVYIARWADGVTKVGRTINPRRVRGFEIRGARITRLMHGVGESVEAELLTTLRSLGAPAFRTWKEAVSHLGAGGTGFTECHVLDDEAYDLLVKEADAHG